MDREAQDALEKVREAVAADRVEATRHFEQQVGARGLVWADMLTILDQPSRMEDQGVEDHGWPKWRIWGQAADGTPAAVVVAIRADDRIRFITIHWED
jgi:hypothetical protein